MRKFLLTAALGGLAMVLPAGARAQTATATVNVSATISAALTATTVENLNFGTAIPAAAATITVAPGSAPAGTGQTLGAVEIAHNSNFSTAVSGTTAMTGPGGTLTVTYNCAYSATATGAVIGSTTACGSMANRAVTTPGTTQTTYLQVGGALTIPASPVAGTYTGDISFLFTAVTS